MWASAPTDAYLAVRRGGALPLPRAGKSAKRRRWRMQRAGFEEVPRLADTTVAVSRLARRWAREPLPYAPPIMHPQGRTPLSARRFRTVPLAKAMSLRGRTAPVAIRTPVPSAPLPKGGWHGAAVTGGFFSRTSCNPP